jgi:hypothetical protein
MSQENEKLLLKDLCARLPYEVKGILTYDESNTTFTVEGIDNNVLHLSDAEECYVEDFKPYLRPMSSMTEDEFEELKEYSGLKYEQLDLASYQDGTYKCLDFYLNEVPSDVVILVFDWLNTHHFDYRGLIERGLALEAPEGMYD